MTAHRFLLAWLAIVPFAQIGAQQVDLELLGALNAWQTDAGSRLLARNGGDPGADADLYAFAVWRPAATLRLMAISETEGESGHHASATTELQLLSMRWWPHRALRIEAGRILLPIGEFAPRRFATTNPLIGEPDTYAAEYPLGASIGGAAGPFDYMASVVSLPAVNQRYTPEPGFRMRPAVGLGLTAGPELHVGAAVTHGSYLGDGVADQLPAGTAWQQFNQTVATMDVRFSRGRFDSRGEAAWSWYQVPGVKDAVAGLGWYLEVRATLSPRWFVAARAEHNRYAFIQPVGPGVWIGSATIQMNAEIGVGYRPGPATLLKASVRADHWPVHQVASTAFPDGYQVAVQASFDADVLALLSRHP
ncbi:MAG: hypothetical protein ACREL5_08630 [Gemmatimonadales bacterium]